jgi:hypothetical protein
MSLTNRRKYVRDRRVRQFLLWLRFKLLDFIWGNGESTAKLLRTAITMLLIIAIIDVQAFGDPTLVARYRDALSNAPAILLGVTQPPDYPPWYATTIVFVRLVFFGFFMATIVKRFNRR